MRCPNCGGCDGYIMEDWGEPVWFACRDHRVRWQYLPTEEEKEENEFSPAWLSKPCEAIVPEVLSYRVAEGMK